MIKLHLRDVPPLLIKPRLVNVAYTLAIHKPIRGGQESNLKGWTISHIPTGLRIIEITGHGRDLKSATKALNCLDIADWNFGQFGQGTLRLRDQTDDKIKYALTLCWESIYGTDDHHPILGPSSGYCDADNSDDSTREDDALLDLCFVGE